MFTLVISMNLTLPNSAHDGGVQSIHFQYVSKLQYFKSKDIHSGAPLVVFITFHIYINISV